MKKHRAKRTIVIGIGHEFRGDDAAGLIVARKIEKEKLSSVETVLSGGDGAALIEAWRNADSVIIVDACRSGSPAGTIFRFKAGKQKLPESFFNYSTHAFSVTGAIELARALECLPPHLIVYAVEGKIFDLGCGLSPEVEGALQKIYESIMAEVPGHLEKNAG